MNEKEWMEKLKTEGFIDLKIVTINPGDEAEHNHDFDTVNVLLEGELTIIDEKGEKTYYAGDRVDTYAGTSHSARGNNTFGRMIIGIRK